MLKKSKQKPAFESRPATWLDAFEQLEQFKKLEELCRWARDAKKAAREIDPANAEVHWGWGDPDHPYAYLFEDFGDREGFGDDGYTELNWLLTHDHLISLADKVNAIRGAGEKSMCLFYARAPESGGEAFSRYGEFARQREKFEPSWVWFGDLPETVRNALWKKHKEKFPDAEDSYAYKPAPTSPGE